ncbi:lycopene cyclase domain-containing protein [Arthrobacter monumenti]
MMGITYLAVILFSLAGMVILDARLKLFFWLAPVRAAVVTAAGLVFFTSWDLAGISLGIFFRGESAFMTGIEVAPELPLEELFFLTFLSYLTMNLFQLVHRRLATGRLQPDMEAAHR